MQCSQKYITATFVLYIQAQSPVREDIKELKEDICNFKQEMMVCTYSGEWNLFALYIPSCTYQQFYYTLISMQAQSPVREDIIELKKDICNFKQEMMVSARIYLFCYFYHTVSLWKKCHRF